MKPKTVRRAQADLQAKSVTGTRETLTLFDVRLTADTVVRTARGEIPARDLKPDDRVITRDAGMQSLAGVQQSASLTRTVRFTAACLDEDADLILPASQPIWLRDWRAQAFAKRCPAAVSAFKLIDEEFVRDLGHRALDLVHLFFDTPHVIYAGGLELSTHRGRVLTAAPVV